jgi:putative restriction endonuclease
MTAYWWVNHKQTVRQEIDGQYLWSPKRQSNGASSVFYDNMRRATPGDLILSYAGQLIRSIGRVAEFAFTAPKPAEFGSTGAHWENEGWLLPVFWAPLLPAVRPKNLLAILSPLLPTKYSPIRASTGDGNQAVYLASISKEAFDTVAAATTYDYLALMPGGANSLTFQVVTEILDDAAELAIRNDLTLEETVKKSIVQARRGQGLFRSNVEFIEKSCRLTGVTNPSLLIASHIKPWRACETAHERLDGMNGLMLTPDADLLFDRGFISFENDGDVLVSSRVDREDLRRLGFQDLAWDQFGFSEATMKWQTSAFAMSQRDYLAYHRSQIYVQ